MAFTAGIKRSSYNENSNYKPNQYDRLVKIISYDLAQGKMLVEDENSKQYEVHVDRNEYARCEQSIQDKGLDKTKIEWMGHAINAQMEKKNPVGSFVVLERSVVLSNDKTRNVAITEVTRIVGVPHQEADKVFRGILTMNYRIKDGKKIISRVQRWNPNGIDINDSDNVQALKEMIDKQLVDYGKKIGDKAVTVPTVGVQFRALLNEGEDYVLNNQPTGKKLLKVVDMSVPFDWINGPEDEQGQEIKTDAHNITGDEMIEFARGYVEHIKNNENFKNVLDKMSIEITYYQVYPASQSSDSLRLTIGVPEKDVNADKNPLYQLSHRQSYIDLEQDDSGKQMGKNFAVNGIVQISGNQITKINGALTEIPTYWVNKVHANGSRGHVHSYIATASGNKAQPHEKLKLIDTRTLSDSLDRDAPTGSGVQSNAESSQNANSVPPQPIETPSVPRQGAVVEDMDTFDPFAAEPEVKADVVASKEENPQKTGLSFGSGKNQPF